MTAIHTLIVGAGPAGLAVAARLKKKQIPFALLEQADTVVSSWRTHYDRLHLHTVNQHSSLPFVAFPESFPQYVSKHHLIEYCESYAEQFDLQPHYRQTVSKILPAVDGWSVDTSEGRWNAKRVVMATGVNNFPVTPEWPGQSSFSGDIVHSRSYKNPDPFLGNNVLVVGMGNTGAEVALDLCDRNVKTSLSVRGPVNIVPRDAFGRPTQLTALKLDPLPNWLKDRLATLTQRLTIGDLSRWGIETPSQSPSAQLRENGRTPVIDLGTVAKIKSGDITVRPDISEINGDRITFKDGSSDPFDAIICCTGYRSGLNRFIPNIDEICDQNGNPKSVIGAKEFDGLYFIGFDNYRAGGILGIINTDSKTIVDHIAST